MELYGLISFFAPLRYLGGAYLMWVGIGLIRSAKQSVMPKEPVAGRKLPGTVTAALLLTLSDIKAILF